MTAPLDPETIYGPCSICAAVGRGEWPHGFNTPCPQKVKLDDAYIAMLDAQRMSYIRSGESVSGMGDTLRKLAGGDEEGLTR